MESFSGEPFSLSNSNYFVLLFVRPIAAVVFTLSLLFFGWVLAWKLVLVHVPLVQEIFRLKEKPNKPKPADSRKLTRFYNRINAQMLLTWLFYVLCVLGDENILSRNAASNE